MTLQACPTGSVAAPAATVWWLLAEPERLDLWWDARVERAEPEGPLSAGQKLYGSSRALARRFPLAWDIEEVNAGAGVLRMLVHMPFGIRNHVTLRVTPMGERQSRLSFG
jgi:hypothetical protein